MAQIPKSPEANAVRDDVFEDAAMPYHPDAGSYERPSEIDAVRERHQRALMAIDGVVGVAVGQTPTGDPAIVLYLRDPSVRTRVPTQLDGHPVQTVVTGEIDAYSGTHLKR